MIRVTCPHCSKVISAAEANAGKKVKCPLCEGVMVLPASPEKPESAMKPASSRPPGSGPRSSARSRRPARSEADEVESPEESADKGEEERPRKRRKKGRGERWARCPECGSRDATKVRYTLWGGAVGPLLISTVRCNECGTQYNGKHGDYNTIRIVLFVGVSLLIGVALAVLGFLEARQFRH
jgi:phage FluMu protein Com